MKQSVRKSVDVQFFKSVDMPESQSYQGVAGSGGDMAYTISSAARYDHFDTLPYKIVGVIGENVTRFRVSPVMTTSIPLQI